MYEAMFQEPDATRRQHDRSDARQVGGRLVYDCYCAKVTPDMRVRCSAGHSLNPQSKDGTASLPQIIRGIKMRQCQLCRDYNDGGEVEPYW